APGLPGRYGRASQAPAPKRSCLLQSRGDRAEDGAGPWLAPSESAPRRPRAGPVPNAERRDKRGFRRPPGGPARKSIGVLSERSEAANRPDRTCPSPGKRRRESDKDPP